MAFVTPAGTTCVKLWHHRVFSEFSGIACGMGGGIQRFRNPTNASCFGIFTNYIPTLKLTCRLKIDGDGFTDPFLWKGQTAFNFQGRLFLVWGRVYLVEKTLHECGFLGPILMVVKWGKWQAGVVKDGQDGHPFVESRHPFLIGPRSPLQKWKESHITIMGRARARIHTVACIV